MCIRDSNETDLDFNGKKIYLEGLDYHAAGAQPVIDCQQAGRAFYFGSGETKDCVIDNFTIQNGRVEDAGGGAILCENASPAIARCVFRKNRTEDTDGSCDGEDGGAIYCEDSCAVICNCSFFDNEALGQCAHGGALSCQGSSNIALENCDFVNNKASKDYGGAIFAYNGSSVYIKDCRFIGNYAYADGGAIYVGKNGSLEAINCLFDGNEADPQGQPYIFGGGAIMVAYSSGAIFHNCTFYDNWAKYGGAVFVCHSSTATLNNCILWGNTASVKGEEVYVYDSGSSCTLNYCCVDNTGYGGGGTIDDSNNCIHEDPQFVDAANGDYHLKNTSPCIDAGDNSLVPAGLTTDFDGKPRIVDGDNDGTATVDIGAYEKQ